MSVITLIIVELLKGQILAFVVCFHRVVEIEYNNGCIQEILDSCSSTIS